MAGKIRHIAVIRFSAMGDVAMTVPVISALTSQYKDVKVTFVSRPFFKPLFDEVSNVRYFSADLNEIHKGLPGLIKLHRELKQLDVDAVADLHQVIRSRFLVFLFRLGGVRSAVINKGRSEKKALTRLKNKIFKPLRSGFDRYADVFSQLGLPINLSLYRSPGKPELDGAVTLFTGNKSSKWIGIAPFAQHQGKVYPDDLMSEVITELAATGIKIFLFGGSDEKSRLAEMASGNPGIIIVAGRLTFAQEINLIRNLDLMLSMDSANAHIAAIFGVKTVTLWGATHPYAGFAPFRQSDNAIISDRERFPGLPTSVYGNKVVPGYEEAMRTILPETVIEKVLTELDQTSS